MYGSANNGRSRTDPKGDLMAWIRLVEVISCTVLAKDIIRPMKPLPPPDVPGKTEFQRFDNAVRRVLTVSKEELLRREDREKHKPDVKKRPQKS